jgi:hypothetical protein
MTDAEFLALVAAWNRRELTDVEFLARIDSTDQCERLLPRIATRIAIHVMIVTCQLAGLSGAFAAIFRAEGWRGTPDPFAIALAAFCLIPWGITAFLVVDR